MSTKSTIAYGTDFHIYGEVFDEENVYIELENTVSINLNIHESSKPILTFAMKKKDFEEMVKEYVKAK